MFDLPGVVKAQTIRQLHLLQRFLKQLLLGAVCPRAWQLMLIENAKLHAMSCHPAHEPSLVHAWPYYAHAGGLSQWSPSSERRPEQPQRMSTAPPLLGWDAGILRAQLRR